MDYFEPGNFKEWLKRIFALRPVIVFLLLLGILIAEFRFDWIERALGAYLVKTNVERPESGTIWEIGHRNITAQKTLEQIITDRQAIQREVREASTFVEVAANISPDRDGVMLSPDHFRDLYLSLPPSIAHEIISPFELIRILSSGLWVRTYIGKMGENLTIYLLDRNNRVIRRVEIPTDLLNHFSQQDIDNIGTLEDFFKFENRIYPAVKFFESLETMSEEIRRSIISQPEKLIETGDVLRVGISDEAVYGFIELGFEVDVDGQKRVILHPAPEWTVYMLRSKLEEKETNLRSSFFNEPMNRTE
jgi:hypothetical protein